MDDAIAMARQRFVTGAVGCFVVRVAVHFNDELCRRADEIGDVVANDLLAAEFVPA